MRVLVLGGTGFLGSWIVRELVTRNWEAVVLSRSLPKALDAMTVQYVAGDCNDPDALRRAMAGCDAVFHAAAYYPLFSVDRCRQTHQAMSELRAVLHMARKCEVSKFIFTSSPMVLAADPEAFRRSTYHYIKRLLHEEFMRWIDRGLPGIAVIPGACFGPGDWKPTTGRVIIEIASRRLRFIVEGKMNAVDVRDVAKAQVEVLHSGILGSCYQMGNWNCSFSEFAEMVAQECGVPVPHTRLPYTPLKVIAQMGEWVQYRLGSHRPYLPESGLDLIHFGVHLDSSEARKDLVFKTRPIEATVRDTLDWFRLNNYLPTEGKTMNFVPPRSGFLTTPARASSEVIDVTQYFI